VKVVRARGNSEVLCTLHRLAVSVRGTRVNEIIAPTNYASLASVNDRTR
jgi:hypothetical protein